MTVLQRVQTIVATNGLAPAPPLGLAGRLALAVSATAAASILAAGVSAWAAGGYHAVLLSAVTLVTLGWGPAGGVMATVVAMAACRLALAPGLPPAEPVALLLFAVVSAVDVAVITVLLRAVARARAAGAVAERLVEDLRVGEARFRGLLEAAPDAIVIADAESRIVLLNAEAERMFGYARAEMLGQSIELLMPERFRARHAGRVPRFLENPAVRRMGDGSDMFGRRKDGTEFPIETNLSPLSRRGEMLITSVIRDLTARKQILERQALLVRELNHRVKNTLASVQSIVAQTLRASPDPEQFSAAFAARIAALSQSHDLLTRNDWSGAQVRDIVQEQIDPYARDGAPFRLEGPKVTLGPNRAVTLGMVIGELATNAAKFGALSGAGSVTVTWELERTDGARGLRLVWREHDGPRVEPPTRQGFGRRLVERSLAAGLHGVATLEFHADGVVATLAFPLLEDEA